MAKVVQPKVRQSRLTTAPHKGLREPVRQPRSCSIGTVRKDEATRRARIDNTLISAELRDGVETHLIKGDPMRTTRLRGSENRARRSFGKGALDGNAPRFQVYVGPAKREQLSPVPLSTLRLRPCERRRMTRDHRGSLPLRCRAFSSPSPWRFIPALQKDQLRALRSALNHFFAVRAAMSHFSRVRLMDKPWTTKLHDPRRDRS
jgi:hypothetical protein